MHRFGLSGNRLFQASPLRRSITESEVSGSPTSPDGPLSLYRRRIPRWCRNRDVQLPKRSGQERSSASGTGRHRSRAVFHPDHRVPPTQPLQPLTTVCQYPAGLRLRAPGLELKRFQNAYGAPPPRLDGRIVGIGTPAPLGPWIQGRVRCLRLRIPRTGPTSVFTGPAVGRYVQDVANVTSPDHNFSIPNSRTLRKIQGGTSALGRSPQSRRANQAAFRPRITSASPEIKQRVGRRSSAVRRRE